jgi:hypothetical protein
VALRPHARQPVAAVTNVVVGTQGEGIRARIEAAVAAEREAIRKRSWGWSRDAVLTSDAGTAAQAARPCTLVVVSRFAARGHRQQDQATILDQRARFPGLAPRIPPRERAAAAPVR